VPTLAESPRPSSPDPIAIDSDEESDDPLAMRAIEDLEHGLLSMAGIEDDGVTLTLDEAVEYVLATSESVDMPSLKEAMKSPDKDKWMAAYLEEIHSHTENGSWKWVELPEGASTIGSRWVFKVKHTEDGWSVTRLISLPPSLMENWRTPST
jgi:hypothetical protein